MLKTKSLRLGIGLLASITAASLQADQVQVSGVTALSATEVESVLAPYQGGSIETEDVAAIINSLNQLYRDKGYITSGVVFPEQARSETIRLEALEGRLGAINVTSSGRLSTSHIGGVIDSETSAPLNISELQAAFNRLEREATIEAVRGRLEPSTAQGESVLNLEVVEADAFSVVARANNYRSPSVGAEQIQVQLSHINLTGHGDVLSLGLNHTDGLDSGSIFYSFPVTAIKSRLALYYSVGDTIVVEAPFDAIDLESETDTAGISIETTFVDSLTRTISASLALENKTSETSLLGLPYDFSQGSLNGESDAAVVIASLNFQQRSRQQAFSGKVSYRKGLDALGATIIPGQPDGEFDLWQLQASYVRLIDRDTHDWTFSVSLNSQFTGDTLQSFERFPLGGNGSIRGFRENQVLRDEAWEVRVQLDFPLYVSETGAGSRFSIYPFYDIGEGKNANIQPNVRQSVQLSSIGLGMRYQVSGFAFLLEYGERLEEEIKQDNTLQDEGIHLGVSYEF